MSADDERVELSTWIAARPETVWGRFVDPEDFARWMGGKLGKATIDPRLGGEIRVDFGSVVVVGAIVALDAPRTFGFTWRTEGPAGADAPGTSTVTLTLTPEAGGTRVHLRHDGLPARIARGTETGWALYLGMLGYVAAEREHGARVRDHARAWFDAWAADSDEARDEALARCLADDVEFRDDVSALVGRPALSRHVANSRRFMRGIDLVPVGEAELVHATVRFGWRAVRGDAELVRGVNVAELGPDGRFRRVVGFRDR